MTQWKSTREPPKTKAELYEMLAEAVRNTLAENKRLQRAKRGRGPSESAAKRPPDSYLGARTFG
jgi:hypothetical protein